MKFIWKGRWKGGEITIEADSFDQLSAGIKMILANSDIDEISSANEGGNIPQILRVKGCSESIKTLMETDWGKSPRLMAEVQKALEANGLFFSKGTLSGTLTVMVKKGFLRRSKEGGRWKYLTR
jgi:hypothetical protein